MTIWEFIIITDSNNKASLQHATQPELLNYGYIGGMWVYIHVHREPLAYLLRLHCVLMQSE